MMFFLTLYCGRAEILIEDVSSVILLNTVHFPNWNMTLSQKIALNLCHFFLPVFVSFFVISLSVRKYWLRELWIKKKDWGFFSPFGTMLWAVSPSTALSPVSCTSQHSFLAPSVTFAGWPLAAEPSSHFLGFMAPSALLGSAHGAGLISTGTRRSKLLPVEPRNPAHSRMLQGPEEETWR